MGFLEDTKTIDPINPSKGGFLDNTSPMSEKEIKIRNSTIESNRYREQAKREVSLGSIIKGSPKAVKDLYSPLVKDTARIVDSLAKHTWQTYQQTPQLMMQDIEALSKDFADINKPRPDLKGNFWGSLLEAGRKTGKNETISLIDLKKAYQKTTNDQILTNFSEKRLLSFISHYLLNYLNFLMRIYLKVKIFVNQRLTQKI